MTDEQKRTERKERVNKCVEYFRAGWSAELIAEKMGLNVKSVRRYLDESGDREIMPRSIAAMHGAITPEEIAEFKAEHGFLSRVKIYALRKGRRVAFFGIVLGSYTHFARTDCGCYRWADLIRYSRDIPEGEGI